MRCSLNLRVALLLTIAITSIVQARHHRQSEYLYGNLGSGVSPCRCNEVVVKAAKVQKPLFYASPESINQAAAVRDGTVRLTTGSACENVLSFPKYDHYTSGTYSTSSASSSSSASSNSFSSSGASSIGSLEQPIDRSFHYSFHPTSEHRTFESGCGCGRKSTESLEARDLLSHNVQGQIVPSFPAIGDLCYPTSYEKYEKIRTKVTPAHPGKIRFSPPIPYEVCVNILNGQIDEAGLRKLSHALRSDISAADRFKIFNGLTGGSMSDTLSSFGKYTSNNVDNVFDGYNSVNRYNSVSGYDNSGSLGGYAAKYGNLAGFGSCGDSNVGSLGQLTSTTDNFGTTYGTYGNSFATSNNIALTQGSTGSYIGSSNYNFDDNPEFPEDYSYPQLPADPVSLTLAYKNLFPLMRYNNKYSATFVPEDKLAFGHRTIPIESTPSKTVLDVPEEKLQILDKPVVELKPIAPIRDTFSIYNEQEQTKLAELEAIERERIYQEERIEQPQQQFITYGDLGYAPINGVSLSESIKVKTRPAVNVFDAEDGQAGCGPLGPPVPGYVPGNVIIDRELVETVDEAEDNVDGREEYVRHYLDDVASEEEEDIDGYPSGIFARLRSAARKNKPTCSPTTTLL